MKMRRFTGRGWLGSLGDILRWWAYSIENECVMYSHGRRAEEKFAELGRKVKEWDPTRPILFNGGDDPGGAADVVSLHYPHELPFWNRYPMDAWFLGGQRSEVGGRRSEVGKGSENIAEKRLPSDALRAGCRTADGQPGMYIDSFWYHKPDFCWRWDRMKPLDLGEIGFCSGGKPHMDAILFGDGAYGNPKKFRDRTRAEVWRQSIDAARVADVAMINPWNPPAGEKANEAVREGFEPVRLILRPGVRERYYGGSAVRWSGVLVNDARESKTLAVQYALNKGKEVLHTGGIGPYSIAPGGRQEVVIGFDLPEVKEKQSYEVQFKLATDLHGLTQTGGKTEERILKVYPSPTGMGWGELERVSVFDPGGGLSALLAELGVPYEKIDHGRKLNRKDAVLVIGPGALAKLGDSSLEGLRDRIRNGDGSTLIMEQDSYPLGFSPGLTLNDRHGTSLGFNVSPNHPVLKNIGDRDVQLWGRDGLISKKDFNLPGGGGYTPLIVGGGTGGLIYSPLIERQGMKGTTIFCQLPLVDEFREEPVAAIFLYDLLRYLGKDGAGRTVVQVDLPMDLKANLADKGIFAEALHAVEEAGKLRMVRGGDLANNPAGFSGIKAWVEKGNVLWVYGLEPESTAKLTGFLKGVTCEPFPEEGLPVIVNKEIPLMDGILNQFLYWTVPHGAFTHRFAKLIKPSEWVLKMDKASGGYGWQPLSSPALLMTAGFGEGRILVDSMGWAGILGIRGQRSEGGGRRSIPGPNQRMSDNFVEVVGFDENQEMGIRLFSGLLTNLGVRLEGREAIQIEAEDMELKTPGQPLIRNRNHHYWAVFTNNLLAQDFETSHISGAEDAEWMIEVKARSRVKMDLPPKMRVVLDGKVVGECFVDEPQWMLYRFKAKMKPGKHRVEVRLTNNPDDGYGYRYLHLDRVRLFEERRTEDGDQKSDVRGRRSGDSANKFCQRFAGLPKGVCIGYGDFQAK